MKIKIININYYSNDEYDARKQRRTRNGTRRHLTKRRDTWDWRKFKKYESYPAVNLTKPNRSSASSFVVTTTSHRAGKRKAAAAAGATPPTNLPPRRRETLRRQHFDGVAICPMHSAFLRYRATSAAGLTVVGTFCWSQCIWSRATN